MPKRQPVAMDAEHLAIDAQFARDDFAAASTLPPCEVIDHQLAHARPRHALADLGPHRAGGLGREVSGCRANADVLVRLADRLDG